MNQPSVGPRRKGRARLLKSAAAIAVTALVPTMLSTVPAEGTVTDDPGVQAGHNITVFHNIDMVVAVGYDATDVLTVRVVRGGEVIGTASGPVVGDAVEGFGLEVNHGPETVPPADGDCWEGNVPNIGPGDRIEVDVNGTLTDAVIVDRIRFRGQPRELANRDIVVNVNAFRADGTAIRPGFIDSAEFRAESNNQVRFFADRIIVERRPGALPGRLRMRYRSPFRPNRNDQDNPMNQRQLRRALLGDGHATGFGHVDPLPLEGMLVEGLADTPGPAPGCPGGGPPA